MLFSRCKYAVALILAATALPSCQRNVTPPRPTIPLVRQIVTERGGAVHKRLAAFNPSCPEGPVCIVGEPERCLFISEALMTADDHDNVTGSARPDALPDFAGEEFLSLLDRANGPYGGYISASNTAWLRELTVRHVLDCMDTVSFVSHYDKEGVGRRVAGKMVILASPYMAAYGRFDADTLFTLLGRKSPVISPVDLMFDEALGPLSVPANIALLADSTAIQDGVYQAVFDESVRRSGLRGSLLIPSAPAESKVLAGFLDSYEAAGYTKPLDAIVVDDFTVSIDSLEAELASVRVELSDESLRYGKMLSPSFRIIDIRSLVKKVCYERMREANTFTHNIAYPKADALISAPRTDLSPENYALDGQFDPKFKYSRIPQSEVDTYMLLQYGSRYLPDSVMDVLRGEAPMTYRSYVQK